MEKRLYYKEVPLTIPGVSNITVRYIPESPSASATIASDSVNQQTVTDKASEEAGKTTDTSAVSEKGKSKAGLVFILISLIAGTGVVSFVFISRKRRADFLKSWMRIIPEVCCSRPGAPNKKGGHSALFFFHQKVSAYFEAMKRTRQSSVWSIPLIVITGNYLKKRFSPLRLFWSVARNHR
jgi:hypothetical protein